MHGRGLHLFLLQACILRDHTLNLFGAGACVAVFFLMPFSFTTVIMGFPQVMHVLEECRRQLKIDRVDT